MEATLNPAAILAAFSTGARRSPQEPPPFVPSDLQQRFMAALEADEGRSPLDTVLERCGVLKVTFFRWEHCPHFQYAMAKYAADAVYGLAPILLLKTVGDASQGDAAAQRIIRSMAAGSGAKYMKSMLDKLRDAAIAAKHTAPTAEKHLELEAGDREEQQFRDQQAREARLDAIREQAEREAQEVFEIAFAKAMAIRQTAAATAAKADPDQAAAIEAMAFEMTEELKHAAIEESANIKQAAGDQTAQTASAAKAANGELSPASQPTGQAQQAAATANGATANGTASVEPVPAASAEATSGPRPTAAGQAQAPAGPRPAAADACPASAASKLHE